MYPLRVDKTDHYIYCVTLDNTLGPLDIVGLAVSHTGENYNVIGTKLKQYKAGSGIGIDVNGNISVDTNTVALKSDIPADELPAIAAGDTGKVLAVNSTEDGVEWITPASGGGADINLDYYLELDGPITSNSNNLTTKLQQLLAEGKNFSYAPAILHYGGYYYVKLTFYAQANVTYVMLNNLSPFIGNTVLDRTTNTGKLSRFIVPGMPLYTYSTIPGTYGSYGWSNATATLEDIQKALSNSSANDVGKVITIGSNGN